MVILANNLNNNRKLVSFHGNANANNNCLKRNPSFLIDNEVHSTLSYGGVSSPVAGKSSFQVQHDRLKRPQSAVPTGRKSRSSFQDDQVCLACFHRGDKNENASCARERSAHNKAMDRTLEQYNLFRNKVSEQQQDDRDAHRRKMEILNANFNRGVAQAQKQIQAQKPPYQKMFLLQQRPHTAQVYRGVREQYRSDLRRQMSGERRRREGESEQQFRLDATQQQQLRRQLSAQRRNQNSNDIEKKQKMKESLDYQVLTKIPQLPLAPDRPAAIFCPEEESETSKRQKAKKLAEEQLDLAIMKRQNELIDELMSEYEQQNMLNRNKTQLREEHAAKQLQRQKVQQHLDIEWQQQMMIKQARDKAETLHLLRPGGSCLMDQCAHYPKCSKCFKRINNRGKSNILKDTSAYTSGTRFMI
ncbi:coiled-coil domain-containing protein 81-like [Symsagittifera roscoffensis]|uniref:coiled-coil domain-containing protein 81-like n=1 Tax=Symsagittifera roscoffensis TaxID=84072 RepID=UPI00307C8E44